MKCVTCAGETPDESTFCILCGEIVDPRFAQMQARLNEGLERRAQELLKTNYKDVQALEAEVAGGVAKRLGDWGKALGVVVALPLLILAAVLTVLGIRSFTAFEEKVNAQQAAMTKQGEDLMKESITATKQKLEAETAGLVKELQQERTRLLAEVRTSVAQSPEVKQLTAEVKALKFKIESDPSMPPDAAAKIDAELQKFHAYLNSVGFKKAEAIAFKFAPLPGTTIVTRDFADDSSIYGITMVPSKASSPDLALEEYASTIMYNQRPQENNNPNRAGGVEEDLIRWGLAYYYTCSYHDSSIFAKGASGDSRYETFDLIKDAMSPLPPSHPNNSEVNSGQAQLWAGFFWELRGVVGANEMDKILCACWEQIDGGLKPATLRQSLRQKILDSVKVIDNGKLAGQLETIFKKRDL